MGIQIEPLSGGLVTARDPALLGPGELTRCDNGCYKPYSQSVWKAPTNSTFDSAVNGSNPVSGLRYCAFDHVAVRASFTSGSPIITAVSGYTFTNISAGATVAGVTAFAGGTTVTTVDSSSQLTLSANASTTGEDLFYIDADDLLVAQSNGEYLYAKAGDTGNFASLESVTEGVTLESVHYANKHYLMNGKNLNRVLKSDGTVRTHGLLPVAATPDGSIVAGSWTLSTGIGFYSYWTTEYDKANDLESTFVGTPYVANVTTTSQGVSITRPQQVNSTATHWRLYRSVKMTSTTVAGARLEQIFPDGVRIGEAELKSDGTQMTITDGGSASTTIQPPTTVVYNTGWVAPTLGFTSDNLRTYMNASTSLTILSLGTFGFTGITADVTGIEILVEGSLSGTSTLQIRPVTRRTTTTSVGGWGLPFTIPIAAKITKKPVALTGSETTVTVGSATDKWGWSSWTADDFTDANFYVEISGITGTTLLIDQVRVRVYYSGGQQEGTAEPFPKIVVEAYGIESATGRDGPPPTSTTGEIFQDSLVVNDVLDTSIVRYSFPTRPDSFPEPYYLNFETKDQDEVTCIRAVGNVLIVGLRSQIYRVNFLPREQDPEFDRGRAVELIEVSHGIAGTHCATQFSMSDGGQMLAYASRYGLHVTDGYRVKWATLDLDWEREVDANYVSKAILINNPELYELQLYYVPVDASYTLYPTKMLRFSYHPSHIKEGGYLKVAGPLDRSTTDLRVSSAALAVLSDGSRPLYTGGITGFVYKENATTTSSALQLSVQTREMYLTGFGNEWRYDDLYVHTTLGSSATTPTFSTQLLINKTFGTERTTTAKTYALSTFSGSGAQPRRRDIGQLVNNQTGEGIRTLVQSPSSSTARVAFDYLVIGWEEQQSEDS